MVCIGVVFCYSKVLVPLEKCSITYWWDVFEVEKPGTQLNKITDADAGLLTPQKSKLSKFMQFKLFTQCYIFVLGFTC